MAVRNSYGKITSYLPPSWARELLVTPTAGRVELCMRPTPIHKWRLPGVPSGFQVSVKRDDLTGSTLSGNKVRKLEFLLADALKQGCDSVITFGGLQSNHVRATVLAAKELDLKTHVMVLNPTTDEDAELTCEGNLLLNRLAGANLIIFPTRTDISRAKNLVFIHERMKEYAQKLSSTGEKAYVIPAGGSSALGAWGYIDAFDEMMQQGILEDYDDLFVAAGSGGTIGGLAIAKYLTDAKIKLHAVATHNTEEFIYDKVDSHLQEVGLSDAKARDLVDVVMNYTGSGYAHSIQEELELIVDVCSSTGVPLDPEFCVKGVRGMLGEMKQNPGRFAGKRVLFLHSGGVYGLFDGRVDQVVKSRLETNQVLKSSEVFPTVD